MNLKGFLIVHKSTVFLAGALLVAVFLRFWGLNDLDIQHDAALNSVRALGWFDFLTGLGQTSPIIWFGYIPWWANLSFHDHPLGIFAIQYVFLNLFGESSFVLLLSSALSGVLTAYFIYYLLKRVVGFGQAIVATFLFAISSYAVWVVRTGYTEAVLSLFIILSFLFFVLFVKENKFRYWVLFVIFLSIAILTKYTGIFLTASSGVYLIFFKREVFKNKYFWLSDLLFFVILSPVIFYNTMLWRTRGHFDAAISSMLGMHPDDYSILLRAVNGNIFQNMGNFIINFYYSVSLAFFILITTSMIWLVFRLIKNRSDIFLRILFLNIILIIVMFAFSDTAVRFLTIILPFFCISAALLIVDVYQRLASYKLSKNIFVVSILFIFTFEIFYSINTNLLYQPLGKKTLAYSGYRFNHNGFNELDRYLQENVYGVLPEKRKIETLDDSILNYHLAGREVVLFDDRTHWNSQMWYIHRYQAYYDLPVVFLGDVVRATNDTGDNIFQYLLGAGATGFWLVIAQEDSLIKGDMYWKNSEYNDFIDNMVRELEDSGVLPVKEIKNDKYNQSFFKIYHFYLN